MSASMAVPNALFAQVPSSLRRANTGGSADEITGSSYDDASVLPDMLRKISVCKEIGRVIADRPPQLQVQR